MLLWSIAVPYRNVAIMVCAGVVFTLSIVVVIRLIMDPDSVRARQSDSMLKLASQTLTCMNDGMDYKAAQKICGLLLPSTAAIAVAITDKKQILGYAGFEEAQNLQHHPHPRDPCHARRRQAAHPIHARRYRLPQRVVEY